MKKLFFVLILITNLLQSAHAFIDNESFDFNDKRPYLEDRASFNKIDIHTKKSPLSELKEPGQGVKFWEELKDSNFASVGAETGLNKIVGLASGVIDVTYQVKLGVKAAIKETFGGYAEYQRRKQVEEIVNSTFVNHQRIAEIFIPQKSKQRSSLSSGLEIIGDIFFDSSKTQSYKLISKISKEGAFKKIKILIKFFAIYLLVLFALIKIILSLKDNYDLSSVVTKPIMTIILAFILIAIGDWLLEIHFNIHRNLHMALRDL